MHSTNVLVKWNPDLSSVHSPVLSLFSNDIAPHVGILALSLAVVNRCLIWIMGHIRGSGLHYYQIILVGLILSLI